jgi:hypothetical protein
MPKCKNCKIPFEARYPMQSCCSAVCAIQYAKDNPKLIKKVERDSFNSWKKEVREKHRTHGDYENLLQTEINTIVRLIDAGHNCISCQKPPKKKNAGHYHSVGSNNSLRYHLFNIWLQDEHCNGYQSSNRSGYDKGLKELFGFGFWLNINEGIVRQYPFIKLSIPELKEKIVIARQIAKELTAAGKTFTTQERIELRKEYQERIGIYT